MTRNPDSDVTAHAEALAEQVAEEFGAGKLDAAFGEWLYKILDGGDIDTLLCTHFRHLTRWHGDHSHIVNGQPAWELQVMAGRNWTRVTPTQVGEAYRSLAGEGERFVKEFVREIAAEREEAPDA